MISVLVWNEFFHEKTEADVKELYPDGIHAFLADLLGKEEDITVRTATLEEPEHGLSEEVLEQTDVLIWWGHMRHKAVADEVVERVYQRVLRGMGLICLHSAHHSKIFKKVLGTSGQLSWRDNDRERVWCVTPSHPIAKGVAQSFVLEREEMYGEPFGIPKPDDVIFLGWFAGGEVFRSGVTFTRGNGKIFYFQPGHENNPIFHHPEVQKILKNAVRWAAPTLIEPPFGACPHPKVSPEDEWKASKNG